MKPLEESYRADEVSSDETYYDIAACQYIVTAQIWVGNDQLIDPGEIRGIMDLR